MGGGENHWNTQQKLEWDRKEPLGLKLLRVMKKTIEVPDLKFHIIPRIQRQFNVILC